jgi:hypothetical protein
MTSHSGIVAIREENSRKRHLVRGPLTTYTGTSRRDFEAPAPIARCHRGVVRRPHTERAVADFTECANSRRGAGS